MLIPLYSWRLMNLIFPNIIGREKWRVYNIWKQVDFKNFLFKKGELFFVVNIKLGFV